MKITHTHEISSPPQEMAEIGRPPFGYTFDPDELARLYHQGVPAETLARIGMFDVR